MSTRNILSGTAALALAATAVLALLVPRQDPARASATGMAMPSATDNGAAAPPAPLHGAVLRYRFEARRTLRLAQGTEASAIRTEHAMRGHFELRTADLTVTALRVESRATAGEVDTGWRDLAMGGEIRIRPGTEPVFPDGINAEARRSWAAILEPFLPVLRDEPAWETTEEDSLGTARVRYERASASGALPLELVKRRLGYITLRGEGLGAPRSELEGETRYSLDPSLPVRVTGHETARLVVEAAQVVADATADFEYERVDHVPRFPPVTATPVPATPSTRDTHVLIDRLHSLLGNDGADARETATAVAALARLIEGSPEAVDTIVARLRIAHDAHGLAACALAALAAAGTPEAQRALAAIVVDAAWGEIRQDQALAAFLQVQDPLPELDGVLLGLEEARSAPALLVLAAIGDKVRKSDPRRFDRISARVHAAIESGLPLPLVLDALGNLGPPVVPDVVRETLRTADVETRAAAARALLRVETDDALRLLEEAAKGDASPEVRAEALDTLLRRAPGKDIRDLLVRIAEEDGSRTVRDMAREALAGIEEEGR